MQEPPKNLLDLSHADLAALLGTMGEPRFRADQLFQWLWARGARSFEQMTSLSKSLRARLASEHAIALPAIAEVRESADGTVKLLLRLVDDELVETVLIPEKDHVTQCLSSQVGCAMACAFCSTGRQGFTRNMTQAEICGQILLGRELLAGRGQDGALRNLVFMGMGEPLANLDNLLASLRVITSDLGLGFSTRRVTVSTVGLPGPLEELGNSGLASLAVSLHAPTQELRAKLMPRAAKVPLPELIAALGRYPLKHRERITIEYVLLAGVNDQPEHARELVRLLSALKCKVNLIAFNPGENVPFAAPSEAAVLAFEGLLRGKGLTTTLRKSKGQDISAACGQLKAALLAAQGESC